MRRLLGIMAGAVLGLSAMASPASAAILLAGFDNDAFFNDFENLFDSTGAWKSPTSTPEVGDHLAGIINIQNIDANGKTVFFSDLTDQLTGIFSQKIIGKTIDAGTGTLHLTLGNPTVGTFSKGLDSFTTGLAAGEMFKFYLQTGGGTTPFEHDGSMADDVAKATDGSLWLSVGLDATDGLGPDGIPGTADDTGYMYSHPILGPSPVGEAFGALDAKTNHTGFLFEKLNDPLEAEIGDAAPTFNDLVFTSEFELNPDGAFGRAIRHRSCTTSSPCSPWEFRSNDPATVHPVVPEVSSLWMLGMGLSGLGIFRRKRFLI